MRSLLIFLRSRLLAVGCLILCGGGEAMCETVRLPINLDGLSDGEFAAVVSHFDLENTTAADLSLLLTMNHAIAYRLGLNFMGSSDARVAESAQQGVQLMLRKHLQKLDLPALTHHPKWRLGPRRQEAERLLSGFFAARRGRDSGS